MDFQKNDLLQDPQRISNFLKGRKQVLAQELEIIRNQRANLESVRYFWKARESAFKQECNRIINQPITAIQTSKCNPAVEQRSRRVMEKARAFLSSK